MREPTTTHPAATSPATPGRTPSEHRLREAGLPVTDLGPVLAEETDPLLFVTVSGAHLYGFPSRDSDIDLRGVHVLPVEALIGLDEPDETRTRMGERDGVEMDLVTHDLRKFARLMLRRNGYVLEQLLSPLVVHTTDAHRELASVVPALLTSHHAHHYAGFAATQWRLFERTGESKPLLYTFRALLTGIHLMRGGGIEAHLPTLLGEVAAPAYLPDLIAAKTGAEHGRDGVPDRDLAEKDVTALRTVLEDARAATALPGEPGTAGRDALHALVVKARLSP
ncbi:nucleotidyltransferase domain-containing protein [Streptomyces liangshanensis]|uniref:nucleotidyltransferase domain-containing protein n=1 Tax=Streptomyces liangshanensis TaxID=2717324 RepID=UPI0036D8E9D1